MRKFKLLLSFVCLFSFFAGAVNTADEEEMNKRKAEYFYLEALTRKESGDNATFYELMRRAHELDKSNATYAYYLGTIQLMTNEITDDELRTSLDLMDDFAKAYPDELYENYVYAMLNQKMGKFDTAISVLDTLIASNPDKSALYASVADCYAGKGDFEGAVNAFNKLEEIEGKSYNISLPKVRYMMAMNDTAAVIQEGRDLLKTNPKSPLNNLFMGELYDILKHPDSALVYYDKALELDPENGKINLSKAFVYRQMKDSVNYEKEIRLAIFNKGVDMDTKFKMLETYVRASIFENDTVVVDKQKSERVENMFRSVLSEYPRETEFLKLYCSYLSFYSDYEGAAEQMQYVVDLDPTDIGSWVQLMNYKMYAHKYDEALKISEKALSYNPDDLQIKYVTGIIYSMKKDYANALKQYEFVLKENAEIQTMNDADLYSSMGDANNALKNFEEAKKCYDYAVELSPNNLLALNNYAYMLAEQNMDIDKAEKMSKKAVDGDPENVSYLDTYAWICFVKQDYKKALEYIEKVMEIVTEEEKTGELLEHYGDILFMNARPADAVEQWKKALKLGDVSDVLERKVKHKTYFYE